MRMEPLEMRRTGDGAEGAGRGRGVALARAGAVLGALLLALMLLAPAEASSAWAPDPVQWTNGVVLCKFPTAAPTVSVSANDLNGTGLTMGLANLVELRPGGLVAASADLAAASWNVTNASNDDEYDLAFTAIVPILVPSSGQTSGSTDLAINYVLPAYEETTTTELNVVALELNVTNWTWQSPSDSLAASFAASPAFPATEHLAPGRPATWLLTSVETSSNDTLEWMQPGAEATASSGSGATSNISAVPTLDLGSASAGTVSVAFAPAGAYRSLSYDSQIGIVLPATVAGIPIVDFALVAGIAIAASLAVAGVVVRVRARPSRIIYADEEVP